ncbi:MAG: capsular polysaccharide synthesis protein [Alphaproteobacteria bacterium]|nr:capsular polysaccharide synthesis protein [Alphaproteobacteria bacterium]
MNLARTIAMADVILNGHVLNWFWRTREHRRAVRSDVIARVIPRYFRRYLPAAATVAEKRPVRDDKNEKIFSIWLQGEENAPELVKACFRSVRAHCSQELVVLDEKTLFEYIKLPDIIMEKRRKGMIKNAHFADICRVELLYQYGGFWLDSTGFVTSPIPQWIVDQDFFVYMAGQNVGSPYSFMQNCFIRARRGAYLLAAWRAMILDYWSHENGSFDYFMHQLLFKTMVMGDARAKKYFEKMPHIDQDPTHALWWTYQNAPFDQKTFDDVTGGAFFQKLTYRGADCPVPGSFADVMINKMNK